VDAAGRDGLQTQVAIGVHSELILILAGALTLLLFCFYLFGVLCSPVHISSVYSFLPAIHPFSVDARACAIHLCQGKELSFRVFVWNILAFGVPYRALPQSLSSQGTVPG
jgi:hypothetical protein